MIKLFCVVSPVFVVIQRDVGELIALDSLEKIFHGFLFIAADVIRAAELHLLQESRNTQRNTT